MNPIDTSYVDTIIAEKGRDPRSVIPILQAVQNHYRYLPEAALKRVCEISDITPSLITGVSTFYTQFRHEPVGKHMIHVCHGTACHVKNAGMIQDALEHHLGLSKEKDTDADGIFTVEKVACLGCCTLAPVIQVDDVTYGHLTPDMIPGVLRDFLTLQKHRKKMRKKGLQPVDNVNGEIRIGLGSCCVARGSQKVFNALQQSVAQLRQPITIKQVGCVGMCHQTPLLEIVKPGGRSFLYALVEEADVHSIVKRHFKTKGVMRKLAGSVSKALDNLLTDETWQPITRYAIEVRDPPVDAFLGKQKHIASEHCGIIDPLDFEEYRRGGGFDALKQSLTDKAPETIIDKIKTSNLRGRGGAGFHTGTKWQFVRNAAGDKKYVVCNGDEGDPGAFMDRMLLESYPFRIIEGIIIAAHAVGAHEGYLYIRAEYPLAVKRMRDAINRCKAEHLLGDNILDSGYSLDLHIMEGAGAFICGEETALIKSIEGNRGMPRLRPPFPANQGLWGKPTLVNNVETYAMVPWIIRNGPDAFAALGTPKSAGTKVFALAGKIERGGLIEVPMGITLRDIVEDIGGGVAGGKRFKAVQIGGPSGGCIPASLDHTTVDYEALTAIGAIMGSGGLVVLDDADCMVDIARYFLEFTQDQSCGKCTFCRVGTRQMLDILESLCRGEGKKGDVERLDELAHMIKQGSLCGLGKTAPNPVLTTIQYFRDEYEAHIQGRCPAGKCKALITFSITEDCIGCTLCAQSCPTGAIAAVPYEQHKIDTEKCVRCAGCQRVCPVDSVKVE